VTPACRLLLIGLAMAAAETSAGAQDTSRTYTDSRGKAIVFPLGEILVVP
jgi:hypothetical protein